MPDQSTADQLRAWAKAVEDLRASILRDTDIGTSESSCAPIAEQHLLLALAAVEQAQRFFTLAAYWQMRGE